MISISETFHPLGRRGACSPRGLFYLADAGRVKSRKVEEAETWPRCSCREFVAARVHQIGRQQKVIAADLDMAPSQLARKLAQSPGDSARFTLDDLEAYLRTTGDTAPVLYLVDKYLRQTDRDELLRRIAELEGQLLAATPMRRDGRG